MIGRSQRISLERRAAPSYRLRLMSLRAGRMVHGYRLERRVGSGGFSEVWAAADACRGLRVALKLLRPPIAPSARARLAREAEAHRRIAHRNVCRVEEVLPDHEGIAFELLAGPALAARIEDGPLAQSEALRVGREVLAALEAVHAAGIVHRDVTPANIVFDADTVRLVDFGLAKLLGAAELDQGPLTTDDAALGSLVHQAPEQIDDPRSVDGRADLYGLGSAMFLALAGRPAFRAPAASVLLVLKTTRRAPSLEEATGRPWSSALEAWMATMLARQPQARFPSSREAAAALAELG